MYHTLSHIGRKLNEMQVLWGVGASILLHQYGLVDHPNDIDLLVDIEDIDKVDSLLQSIGEKKEKKNSDTYATKHFYEYRIHGIDIDVMAGLSILHSEGVFSYIFDRDSITQWIQIDKVEIPFTSLEDWYLIYHLIPGREAKVNMIENYLLTHGVSNHYLLRRNLKGNLPPAVKDKLRQLLGL